MTQQPTTLATTDLARDRTGLARFRTHLALDRTTLAWVRTTLTMLTFGFGMVARPGGLPERCCRSSVLSQPVRGTHATGRSSSVRPKASNSLDSVFKRGLLFPGISNFRYACWVNRIGNSRERIG
jgi:hypothetical protein